VGKNNLNEIKCRFAGNVSKVYS